MIMFRINNNEIIQFSSWSNNISLRITQVNKMFSVFFFFFLLVDLEFY